MGCFAPLFQKRSPARRERKKRPFLFGNFFFGATFSKKKWIKDEQSL
jgi:hypothetical protein